VYPLKKKQVSNISSPPPYFHHLIPILIGTLQKSKNRGWDRVWDWGSLHGTTLMTARKNSKTWVFHFFSTGFQEISPPCKFFATKKRNPLQAIHLTPFVFLISEIDCLDEYFDVILCPLDASTLWHTLGLLVWCITWTMCV